MNKTLFVICLLVGVLFLTGCGLTGSAIVDPIEYQCEICEECPEEKALVTAGFRDYYYNEYDEDEILIYFNVYNYGYVEAKHIYVTCKVTDANDRVVVEEERYVGNLASNSVDVVYMEIPDPYEDDDEVLYFYCEASDCVDCELIAQRFSM